MVWLVAAAIAEDPREVEAGTLARVGERIAGAEVVRIETHPEYERYHLRLPAGELPVEVTTRTPGHDGLCSDGLLDVYPRYDLASGDTNDVSLTTFCERLTVAASSLRPRAETVEAPRRSSWAWAVAGVAVAALALALASVRRWSPWAIAAAAGALLIRLGWEPGIFNGGGAGYEKLLVGMGMEASTPYGSGFATLMAPFVWVLGRVPDAVFTGNLVLASLTLGLVWALARREVGAPWGAAAAMALLPVHLAVSRTEAMHVGVTFLAAVALLAGPYLAAAATVLMVWTRPEALVLAIVPAVRAWPHRLALGAMLAGCAARALTLPSDQGVLRLRDYLDPELWLDALLPHVGAPASARAFQVFWHAAFTPAAWWALALVGLTVAGRHRLLSVSWILLATLPFVGKVYPLTDAIRLQLPAQLGWMLLIGAGVARLGRWGWAILIVGVLPYLWSPVAEFAQAREYRFLANAVPKLGLAEVGYDVSPPRARKFAQVMESMGPTRWVPDASVRYYGLGQPPTGCTVLTTRIGPPYDLDLRLPPEGVEVGFFGPCDTGAR